MSYVARQTPYQITVRPEMTTSYRLLAVDDAACPNGQASGTALILLGQGSANDLTLNAFSNPTTGWVRVEGQLKKSGTVLLRVVNRAGQVVQTLEHPDQSVNYRYDLNLSGMPAVIYTLVVEADDRKESFKLVKH
ncbi:MAG: T9SS type A sorting domain-containing protein [Rudanella sp.]|nr:T9SS type A sorting domain-containing protein [Rudanella sp.]